MNADPVGRATSPGPTGTRDLPHKPAHDASACPRAIRELVTSRERLLGYPFAAIGNTMAFVGYPFMPIGYPIVAVGNPIVIIGYPMKTKGCRFPSRASHSRALARDGPQAPDRRALATAHTSPHTTQAPARVRSVSLSPHVSRCLSERRGRCHGVWNPRRSDANQKSKANSPSRIAGSD